VRFVGIHGKNGTFPELLLAIRARLRKHWGKKVGEKFRLHVCSKTKICAKNPCNTGMKASLPTEAVKANSQTKADFMVVTLEGGDKIGGGGNR